MLGRRSMLGLRSTLGRRSILGRRSVLGRRSQLRLPSLLGRRSKLLIDLFRRINDARNDCRNSFSRNDCVTDISESIVCNDLVISPGIRRRRCCEKALVASLDESLLSYPALLKLLRRRMGPPRRLLESLLR